MAKSKVLRSLAVGLFALAAVSGAYAAGYFPGFPIVGQPSYCSSFTTAGVPGTTPVCNVTVPAGPTNVPSTATFPADTGLASGQQPQTVLIPLVMTGAVAQDAAPLTGVSITIGAGVSQLVLDPAGTIAALTVVLPTAAQLIDGQEFKMSSTQTVTTLTITAGSGTTIVSTAITTLGPTTAAVDLIYHAATAKWVSG